MTAASGLAALGESALGVPLPLRIRAWDGSEAGPADAPLVHVRSRRALRRLLWQPGELGLARAYVTGDLDAPRGAADLDAGLRAMWRLAHSVDRARPAPARLARTVLSAGRAVQLGVLGPRPAAPACEARLSGDLHTRDRDRRAISHHYDLSNEFYALVLDDTMAYSCGYYPTPATTLAQAQPAKLDLICTKLGLEPGMTLLDVGCGWGSLSLHAAERYGVRVTGVTISAQQHRWVSDAIAEGGLGDRAEVLLRDYRALSPASYDAVASIEMGEHVGQQNYPTYVATLHRHLAPGGHLLLQQMSRHAGTAPGGGPFIESYIAPDMHMRPLPETLSFVEAAGFEVRGVQALREHYVRTAADWLAKLEARYDDAVALVGEELARVWRLYLVGGGLAFEEGRMGVDQILARRPAGRPA
ncbi:SAM-dependent methyltransferase [Nocardioides speluncae]|uniref:SAM-dependent methyltransferase n=1 Tax=Nocardioides speluncae TaxID=2670337 RepID=UPI000D69DC41|nr:cyclopropane-fatty-acyl-phospholipid synthase family protein [Nocardioides speluncae]